MIDVEIKGLPELLDVLEHLEYKVARPALRKGLRAGSKVVAKDAKARVPVNTGALRKGISVRAGKGKQRGTIRMVVLTSPDASAGNVHSGKNWYGGIVELGGRKRAAQPFLRPAFDKNKEQIAKALIDTTWEAIKKNWGTR